MNKEEIKTKKIRINLLIILIWGAVIYYFIYGALLYATLGFLGVIFGIFIILLGGLLGLFLWEIIKIKKR